MEKVLTTNESNWDKLKTFGLHFRAKHIGFNRYAGRNSCVSRVDPATGIKVMLIPSSVPRTERAPKGERVLGKRGRPAMVECIMFREPQKRGRKPMQGPIEQLIFFGPAQKRGPKPMTEPMTEEMKAQKALERAAMGQTNIDPSKKRGRLSEKERIALANVGDIIPANGGGAWKILMKGLASYIPA